MVAWAELPLLHSLNGFFIQPKAQALQDANITCMALTIYNQMQHNRACEFLLQCLFRIIGIDFVQHNWCGYAIANGIC